MQLNLSVEDRAITDSFLWSPERVHEIDIWMYTKYLLNDLLMEYDINVTKEQFESKWGVIQHCMRRPGCS